jgi:hypothetical protein
MQNKLASQINKLNKCKTKMTRNTHITKLQAAPRQLHYVALVFFTITLLCSLSFLSLYKPTIHHILSHQHTYTFLSLNISRSSITSCIPFLLFSFLFLFIIFVSQILCIFLLSINFIYLFMCYNVFFLMMQNSIRMRHT